MCRRRSARLRLGVTVAAVGALLAACSSGTVTTTPMGGSGGVMGGLRAASTPGVGMAAPLSCHAPTDLPGKRVTVRLVDMGMSRMMGGVAPMGAPMLLTVDPATVPTGQVGLVVENTGWRTHEVVILPLAPGVAAGQRVPGSDGTVDETGSLGEASGTCAAGAGDGIASGAVGWVTLTLAPGHYELVCNLQNHYANGMRQELVVTG